jgi:hypothetical protein
VEIPHRFEIQIDVHLTAGRGEGIFHSQVGFRIEVGQYGIKVVFVDIDFFLFGKIAFVLTVAVITGD